MKKISNKHFSFVVQGAVNEHTSKSLKSIKKYFPGSKVILSTWKNTKVKGLLFDKIVKSIDPGGIKAKSNGGTVNFLRQKISTLNGLKKVNTKYSIKIRSDMAFYGDKLICYYLNNIKKLKKSKFFESRVLILENGTINPRGIYKMPFHYGDWFYLGTTKDLKKIFSFKFKKKDEILNGFYFKKKKFPNHIINKKYYMRYRSETLLSYFFLKNNLNVNLDHSFHNSKKNIIDSENFLVQNYVLSDMQNIKLLNLKHKNTSLLTKFVRISVKDWYYLYKINYSNKFFFYSFLFIISTFTKLVISKLIFNLKKIKVYL